ncbi:hypothetical protein [Tsuneonella mangrovi]|uniref:hypothetical protein n=1 Tax=Tsuneonella mangrovi TaxID=1982042 RepID=UPI001F0AD179|nr:hypothetical protein [Tsuneonella mangrovi]
MAAAENGQIFVTLFSGFGACLIFFAGSGFHSIPIVSARVIAAPSLANSSGDK